MQWEERIELELLYVYDIICRVIKKINMQLFEKVYNYEMLQAVIISKNKFRYTAQLECCISDLFVLIWPLLV